MSAGNTVVVLGGSGFIGRALLRALAGDAHFANSKGIPPRVLNVDLHPLPASDDLPDDTTLKESVEDCLADLGDPAARARVLATLRERASEIRGVVVLAAYYDFRDQPDARYDRLQAAFAELFPLLVREILPPGAPLIFASSMASLAPTTPGKRLTHNSERVGLWHYPRYKLAAENLLRELVREARGPIVELVLAGVYSDHCELVPLYQTLRLLKSFSPERWFYPGPTDRGLTYIHVDETARAFCAALKLQRTAEARDGSANLIRCLIGQTEPMTYRQIHALAGQKLRGRRPWLLRIPRVFAWLGAHVLGALARAIGRRRFIQPWMIRFAGEHFEFDLAHTRTVLGWSPDRLLADELPAMLDRAAQDWTEFTARNDRRPW